MQLIDQPFIRRQKQNTDVWKRQAFKDNSFEEERSSHIYKKQHRRKSCYCQECGKMSLFQYTYMNVSSCVNYIQNSLILQQHQETQRELTSISIQDKKIRDNISLSHASRSKSFSDLQPTQFELKQKRRKSCHCTECGNMSTFQLKHQSVVLIRIKTQQNQFRIKKVPKKHQIRKQHTEQFSPVKNGEFRYLKKRMIELDLKLDTHQLKKFQLKQTHTARMLHHQQSLNTNFFETYQARSKTDILSPPTNRRSLLPYLQFNQNRSPGVKQTPRKPLITNSQLEFFKKHKQISGIF